MTCACGHIVIGLNTTNLRSWSERCEEHGVGTEYFRNLPVLPFGYADERDTTREDWLAYLEDEEAYGDYLDAVDYTEEEH